MTPWRSYRAACEAAWWRGQADCYGRFLRHVWLEDSTNFGLELVRRGYADAVLYEPNDRSWDEFSEAAEEAQDGTLGLWSACGPFGAPLAGSGAGRTSDRADERPPVACPGCLAAQRPLTSTLGRHSRRSGPQRTHV